MATPQFYQDKEDTIDNLQAIQVLLQGCIDAGMLDLDAHFYNELLDLLDEAELAKVYPELAEVITKAKTLEADIDVWLSMRGKSTLGLPWPKIINNI